jgi:hypothetical protein
MLEVSVMDSESHRGETRAGVRDLLELCDAATLFLCSDRLIAIPFSSLATFYAVEKKTHEAVEA